MKQIVNGKKYDTETAVFIGRDSYGVPGEPRYHEETLYRQRRTGEYFLYGRGGPMSDYADPVGPYDYRDGAKIVPMNLESAKNWAEMFMSVEDYEKEFGPVREEDGQVPVTVYLPVPAKEKLEQAATDRGVTLSAMIREWADGLGNKDENKEKDE